MVGLAGLRCRSDPLDPPYLTLRHEPGMEMVPSK
jgi:hypothetical protein